MTRSAIGDTGPIVAYLDASDQHHQWAVGRFRELSPPLLVCEPVLTEATYLLSGLPEAQDRLLHLVEKGAWKSDFRVDEQAPFVRALIRKYCDRPMSLADACVVRLAELNPAHRVLTLDSDFSIYRKRGRQPILVIHPSTDS